MPGLEPNPHLQPQPCTPEQLACLASVHTYLDQVRKRIEELLTVADPQIQQCLDYLNRSPGKMLRPGLVLLCGAAAGPITPQHIDLAAMVELVHRASLLHDDVIDGAGTRRGDQTANTLWGNTVAVLLGDFLLCRAFHVGAAIQVDGAADVLCQTARELCCGELQQNLQKEQWDICVEQYDGLIEAKTASLFISSCRLGAMAADAAIDQVEAVSRFGRHVGLAFQMSDDLLDIISTSKAAGKTLGTDLRQGKLTLAVIHWINSEPDKKQARIAHLNRMSDRSELADALTQNGSIDYAAACMQHHIDRAKQCLQKLPETDARQALERLADYIANRLK